MFTPSSQQMKIECHQKSKEPSGSLEGSAAGKSGNDPRAGHSMRMSGQTTDGKISKTDNIRRGLEKTISDDAKQRINTILTNISHLSDVEKFLLYLKLPTGAGPCPTPQDSLANRTDLAHLSTWLKTHLEEDPNICLPKQEAFDEYNEYCDKHGYKAVGQADFGRMVRAAFPNVKPRRLGPRGQSKHCYGGMKKRVEFSSPKLPEVKIPVPKEEIEDGDLNESDSVLVASSSLVCEWAQKLLNNEFLDVRNLAEYLVSNSYVDGRSEAAFTVIAASQKAGRALNIVVPDEPSASSIPQPTTSVKHTVNNTSSNRTQSSAPKGPAKLQLQKKLQEREMIKEQKRKLEEQRCEITGEKPAVKPSQEARMDASGEETRKPDFDHTQGGKKVEVHKDKDKGKQKQALTPQKLILPKTLATPRVPGSVQNTFPCTGQTTVPKPAITNSAQPLFMLSPSPACGPTGQIVPPHMVILSPVNRMIVPSTQTQLMHMQQSAQQQMQPQQTQFIQQQQQPQSAQKVQTVQINANSNDSGASKSGGQITSNAVASNAQLVTTSGVSQAQHVLPYGTIMVQPVSSGGSTHPVMATTRPSLPMTSSTTLTAQGGQILSINNQPTMGLPIISPKDPVKIPKGLQNSAMESDTVVTPKSSESINTNAGGQRNHSLLQQVLQKHEVGYDNKFSPSSSADQGGIEAQNTLVSSPSSSVSSDGICSTRPRTTSISTQRSVGSFTSEDSCDSQNLVSPPPLSGTTPGEMFINPAFTSATTTTSSKNSRLKCSVPKTRLSGKTVSTLLKEQRGITHTVPEKKAFENDRRPVAQLLKESREKKHHVPSGHSPVVQLMSPVPAATQTTPVPTHGAPTMAIGVNNGQREQPLLLTTFTLNNVAVQPTGEAAGKHASSPQHVLASPASSGIVIRQPNIMNKDVQQQKLSATETKSQRRSTANTLGGLLASSSASVAASSAVETQHKPNQDLNSGVLAKLLRGEIDVSKVEKNRDQTDTNYSALKQALATSIRKDADCKQNTVNDKKNVPFSKFIEVANIQVNTARKMSNMDPNLSLTNNNKFPTLEALVSQKPNEKDLSNIEKDALQEYLGTDPVPDLADINPSIAHMVNCQDEGTFSEHSKASAGLFELTQALTGQTPQDSTAVPSEMSLIKEALSAGQNLPQQLITDEKNQTAADKLLNAAQMMIDSSLKLKDGQDILNNLFSSVSNDQRKDGASSVRQFSEGPSGNISLPMEFIHNSQSGTVQGMSLNGAAMNNATLSHAQRQLNMQLQTSPAPSVMSHHSTSSTPLSMLSPPSAQPTNPGSVEPCNSFMPIQDNSLDGAQGLGSPAQSQSQLQMNNQIQLQPGASATPAQTQGFLPYASYKQPPDYETVQNERLMMQHQMHQQQAHVMRQQQQQQQQQQQKKQKQPQTRRRSTRAANMQNFPQAQKSANTSISQGVHNNLPGFSQFAPASSIKPVKRGRSSGNVKGSKRVRHSSAQDSLLSRPSGQKEIELASLLQPQQKTGPTVGFGGNKEIDPNYLSVAVPGTEQQGNPSYSNNPPESPFSPEIQDIMGSESDQVCLEQSIASMYRSHSVPALMLGCSSDEIQDIINTNATIDQGQEGHDLLDSLPNSEIASLLQGKLQQDDALSGQRGIPGSGRADYAAKKNLTELLESRLEGESPHRFITRGDHLISGATVRPPLQYALQQHVNSMIRTHNPVIQPGQSYTSNPAPTPPSSQNPTPDFSGELVGGVSDGVQGYGVVPSGSTSAMDTPNSLEPVPSQDNQNDLVDPLFSSTADISPSMAAEQQISIGWN